jgi:O-antigen/teichoic acid export membrane protein
MTNFAVGIYVARTLGVAEFGIFSLAWVTYAVVLNVSRGLATDPLVVRFSGVATGLWREAVARSSGTALRVGILAGSLSVLAGIAIGGALGGAFIGLGLILPALMLQDSWRFAFFAAGRGYRSFISDMSWAASLAPLLLLASREPSVGWFMLAWGGCATVGAVVSLVQARAVPLPNQARRWLVEQRDLGPRYLVENLSISGAAQLTAYGLGAIAGLAAVGTIRGAELLMGPFLMIMSGVGLIAVPEAARVLRRSIGRLRAFCFVLGGAQAALALSWGTLLLLAVPDRYGELVLGEVWTASSALIVPATLAMMSASMITGAAAGLRALGMARRSLRSQLLASIAYVTCGLTGAWFGGALGASWGGACATFIGMAIWWYHLRAGLREMEAPDVVAQPAAEPSAADPAASVAGN